MACVSAAMSARVCALSKENVRRTHGRTSPTNTSHRANYSVTWGDSVSDKDDSQHKMTHNVSKQSDEIGDSGFFTAAMSDSSEPNLDQTKFYDVESSVEMNGWGDDSLNIVDDDTLPSTPRLSKLVDQ